MENSYVNSCSLRSIDLCTTFQNLLRQIIVGKPSQHFQWTVAFVARHTKFDRVFAQSKKTFQEESDIILFFIYSKYSEELRFPYRVVSTVFLGLGWFCNY